MHFLLVLVPQSHDREHALHTPIGAAKQNNNFATKSDRLLGKIFFSLKLEKIGNVLFCCYRNRKAT